MTNDILYCFYDLSVSPPSYDFFEFMRTAELHRKRYGLDEIYFIFVPGPKEGFRDDSLARTISQRHTLMRNVVVPACWLLPSCKGAYWLQDRDEIGMIFENKKSTLADRLKRWQQFNRTANRKQNGRMYI